jgi:transposase-like protein
MARKKKIKREKELDALVDQLLEGERPEDILNEGGLVQELKKRLVERALEGEMTDHLGYEKRASEGRDRGNSRNGKTSKRVKTGDSEVEIEVPRDREGSFEPKLVPKGRRRLPGFDDKVIALYARGMTTREIQDGLNPWGFGCSTSRTLAFRPGSGSFGRRVSPSTSPSRVTTPL